MIKPKPLPTLSRLKQLLRYEHDTGKFFWLNRTAPNMSLTKEAGFTMTLYGRSIQIDNVGYYSHRLAWLYHYGVEPENHIDHIDGNKLNNKSDNLRDVTFDENIVNVKNDKLNKCGFAGVTKWGLRFAATISFGSKHIRIGVFDTALCAHRNYMAYKRILHPTANRFFAGE